MKKYSLLLAIMLVVSVFMSACYGGDSAEEQNENNEGNESGETASDVPQELRVMETSAIPAMDTILASDTISFTTMNNVFEGLYRLSADQEPVPALAEGEPEVNEEGTVYTFKIKEDAVWSNGDPVTANDFVYAWQRALNPDSGSSYGPYLMEGKIKGASEVYNDGAAPETLGAVAVDDKTLEVTLEKPVSYFVSLMAFPTFFPQNQAFVEEQGENYASNAATLVYNGPFVLDNWDGSTDGEWTYAKNTDYWDAENVALEKVTFNEVKDPQTAVNAYEAGEADITSKLSSALVPQYEDDPNMVSWLEPTVFWIKMNQTNEALQNINIRRALALSINKQALTDNILNNGSIPANYAVPKEFVTNPDTGEDFREANGDMLEYDLEAAKEAWAKGLEELGTDTVELRYLGGDTESAKLTDEFIADQLQQNLEGLTIKLESVPFSVRLDRDEALDYDLQFAGWGPDYLDPISFSDLWITDGGNNHMAFSSEKYDQLLKDAESTYANEPGKRFETLQEAERVLLEEEAAIIPVYQRQANILVNEKVKDFTYHFVGPEYSYFPVSIGE
ncbi:peptide ABC transporter substrate-binding protein [Jeotgalibacillus proteolyticus]|uniref:Peptide ABC transporter substrate-binding protein n=1 Tax=Jeotgalibacillus proteolyticus TaxID=2082395 RepID=A0A2S5GHG2_9BACL|nr:peptide ABC transporter substrate-binding protein [Jeotgalibacillus proteolyticus]PPA72335.1 peptide ABC transporter substrate-binding protein [Jeotgalibacillus proteolyticus]